MAATVRNGAKPAKVQSYVLRYIKGDLELKDILHPSKFNRRADARRIVYEDYKKTFFNDQQTSAKYQKPTSVIKGFIKGEKTLEQVMHPSKITRKQRSQNRSEAVTCERWKALKRSVSYSWKKNADRKKSRHIVNNQGDTIEVPAQHREEAADVQYSTGADRKKQTRAERDDYRDRAIVPFVSDREFSDDRITAGGQIVAGNQVTLDLCTYRGLDGRIIVDDQVKNFIWNSMIPALSAPVENDCILQHFLDRNQFHVCSDTEMSLLQNDQLDYSTLLIEQSDHLLTPVAVPNRIPVTDNNLTLRDFVRQANNDEFLEFELNRLLPIRGDRNNYSLNGYLTAVDEQRNEVDHRDTVCKYVGDRRTAVSQQVGIDEVVRYLLGNELPPSAVEDSDRQQALLSSERTDYRSVACDITAVNRMNANCLRYLIDKGRVRIKDLCGKIVYYDYLTKNYQLRSSRLRSKYRELTEQKRSMEAYLIEQKVRCQCLTGRLEELEQEAIVADVRRKRNENKYHLIEKIKSAEGKLSEQTKSNDHLRQEIERLIEEENNLIGKIYRQHKSLCRLQCSVDKLAKISAVVDAVRGEVAAQLNSNKQKLRATSSFVHHRHKILARLSVQNENLKSCIKSSLKDIVASSASTSLFTDQMKTLMKQVITNL